MSIVGVTTFTTYSSVSEALRYAADPAKTVWSAPGANVPQGSAADPIRFGRYVSCLNLMSPESAAAEFLATQNRWDKAKNTRGFHVINGFPPSDPIEAPEVHAIGCALAERLFPGHEVLIATHLNRPHLHSHILANPVSFVTGKRFLPPADRFWYSCPVFHAAQVALNEVLVAFGREPEIYDGKLKDDWQSRRHRSPAREQISQDVRAACAVSDNVPEMLEALRETGYEVRETNGRIELRPADKENFWSMGKLFYPWELKVMTEDGAMAAVRREEKRRMNMYLRPFSPEDTIDGRLTAFEAQILYSVQVQKKYTRMEIPDLPPVSVSRTKRVLGAFRKVRSYRIGTEKEAEERIRDLCTLRSGYTKKIRDLKDGILPDDMRGDPKVLTARLTEERKAVQHEIGQLRIAAEAARTGLALHEKELKITQGRTKSRARTEAYAR